MHAKHLDDLVKGIQVNESEMLGLSLLSKLWTVEKPSHQQAAEQEVLSSGGVGTGFITSLGLEAFSCCLLLPQFQIRSSRLGS